jgi:hypothetical protein
MTPPVALTVIGNEPVRIGLLAVIVNGEDQVGTQDEVETNAVPPLDKPETVKETD